MDHGCDCIGTEHEDSFCVALETAGKTFRAANAVNYNFFMFVMARVFKLMKGGSK